MRTGRYGLLLIVAILLVAAGCSTTPKAAKLTTAQGPRLGEAKSSLVAGLPMPSSAVFGVGKRNELAEYRMPSGVSLASLNQWFDQHLPRSWKQWKRCQLNHAHGPGSVRF
jgi:hypothetical protein